MATAECRRKRANTLRLLIAVLFFIPLFLSMNDSGIIFTVSSTHINVEQTITIDIKVIRDMDDNAAKNKVTLKSNSKFEIIFSEVKEYDAVIEASFEIKIDSIGECSFDVLLNDKKINNDKPITIYVLYPEINTTTKFVWKVFSLDGIEVQHPMTQGEKYILVLYGAYDSKSNSVTRATYEQTETMLLQENKTVNMPYNFFTQVIAFEAIPLHYANVKTPIVNITYASSISGENKISISEEVFQTQEKIYHENLGSIRIDSEQSASRGLILPKVFSDNELTAAMKIYLLRTELEKSFLHFENIKRIEAIERKLKITKSFFPLRKQIMIGITALLALIFGLALVIFRSKKFLVITVLSSFLVLAIVCFKVYTARFGVVYAEQQPCIKAIPSQTSNQLCELQIGETVLIKSFTDDWCCIRTYGGIEGWIERKSILEITQ